ncbi:type II secretion system F family protein [Caldinitratiruptor microaerophilus]|uniref:Type II secretion system protein GspF domain-containing protein n=1 Tax=Caldinitratiruptor microaerophilus TaxID=671077 RepID=A0AA35CIL2_9FIRM|nr:type II secretion system F family protein [Caldinitratiruptor microaerophilus]BDG59762.1 hypothetical protein caldi_08520 [Caldinitratiruptor microaerophilus]
MIPAFVLFVASVTAFAYTLLAPPPLRPRRVPLIRRQAWSDALAARLPRPVQARLDAVGWPPTSAVALILGGILAALLFLPALGFKALLLALAVAGLSLWSLEGEYRRWQAEIFRELPMLADLLEIHLAAGDTPLRALAGAAPLLSGPLRLQVQQALARAALGQDFSAAVHSLGQVTGRPEMAAVAARLAAALQARATGQEAFATLSDSLRRTAEAEVREVSRRMPAAFALIAMLGLFNLAVVIGGPILLASLHSLARP